MSKYVGMRHPQTGAAIVSVVDGKLASPLDPGLRYATYSLGGFDWGSVTAASLQLAFALLLDFYQAPGLALLHCRDFCEREIATINVPRWELTPEEIEAALERIRVFRSRDKSEEAK
jgi:hypothetical protein